MKKRYIIIFSILFLIAIILNNLDTLLAPYYKLKDLIYSPVEVINSELELSDELEESIIEGLKRDNEELLRLNKLTESLSNFNYIKATIIERNREYWFNSFTINKGKNDGIDIDMAVIDEKGLIGRINSVTNNSATVKLITTNDTKSKISAIIYNNNEKIYGIINGYDNKNNLLNLVITSNNVVEKDSKVETTGMGGVFPSNILIGKVYDVIKDDDGITNIVRIVPISNIEGEKYVMVLQRKEISNN